jgi:hypothetical protein
MEKLKRAQTSLSNLAHKSEIVRCIKNTKIIDYSNKKNHLKKSYIVVPFQVQQIINFLFQNPL